MVDFSYGVSYYSTATGKSIPLSPLGNRDVWGFDNGARALPSGIPRRQDRPAGHLHAGRRLHRRTRSPSSAGCSATRGGPVNEDGKPGQNWGATFGNRFGNLGVVASVTHSYKEQFVEEDRALLPHRGRRASSRTRATTTSRPARRRRSSASSATSSYQFTPNQRHHGRELLHAQRPRRGAVLPGRQPRQRPRVSELPPAVHRGRADLERRRRRALLPGSVEQPPRLACELRARATRDEPDLRETLYERPSPSDSAGRPMPFTYADESQSGFRMFNELDDDTMDAAVNWSVTQRRRRPADAVQVRHQLRRSDARLPVAPLPLHSDHDAEGRHRQPPVRQPRCRPSSCSRRATSAPRSGSTRRRGRSTPTPATRRRPSGYGMVDLAMTSADAADRRRPRRAVRPDGDHAGSVRPVRRAKCRRRTRTRTCSPASISCRRVGANSNIRLSYSTTVNRPEFRELAEFEFTDVVGNRAVKGNAESEARADSERRRPVGDVQRRPERPGGERVLQVLRQADRARRHRRREPDRDVPELRPAPGTSASSSRPGTQFGENFFLNAQLHVRRLEDHAAAGAARRCRRRSNGRWPGSRRTCST